MNPVSRITGEERAEFVWAWGAGFDRKGAAGGGGGTGMESGSSICAMKPYILQGDKSGGFGNTVPVYIVYPVSRTTIEERAERSRGRGRGRKGF